jgi:hypothetical protein
MAGAGLMVLIVVTAVISAAVITGIVFLILWIRTVISLFESIPNFTPPVGADMVKYCMSRCWCCLNCLDCQQRRPPGFDPFPKRTKRKYSITQSERKRRSQRMKRRWERDREGMLKKIREGIWQWLLDMESCGCWCCKICSRCQAEKKYKQSQTKPQEKDNQAQEKAENGKKQAFVDQIKSPEKLARSSRKRIKSSKAPQKRKKTSTKTLKGLTDRKSSSPLVKIWQIIKKWGDAIRRFFKRLWARTGLCKQKKAYEKQFNSRKSPLKARKFSAKLSKDARNRKNSSFLAKLWEAIKKWCDTISGFLRNCGFALVYKHKKRP